jgi:hypothetical protein
MSLVQRLRSVVGGCAERNGVEEVAELQSSQLVDELHVCPYLMGLTLSDLELEFIACAVHCSLEQLLVMHNALGETEHHDAATLSDMTVDDWRMLVGHSSAQSVDKVRKQIADMLEQASVAHSVCAVPTAAGCDADRANHLLALFLTFAVVLTSFDS